MVHNLRKYFKLKFYKAHKENEKLTRNIKTDLHQQLNPKWISTIHLLHNSNLLAAMCNSTKKYLKGIKIVIDLKTQNKMIKIADKSRAVRKMVEEYLSDSIASVSDELKKIRVDKTRTHRKKTKRKKIIVSI